MLLGDAVSKLGSLRGIPFTPLTSVWGLVGATSCPLAMAVFEESLDYIKIRFLVDTNVNKNMIKTKSF